MTTTDDRELRERAVSAIAERGERTLVLCTDERAEAGARRMLPRLPDVCFVETGAHTDAAVARAVEDALPQLVLVGTADALTGLTGGPDPESVLERITRDMSGDEALAAEVAGARSGREASELWDAAGVLGPCGRELCRHVADGLERFAADRAGTATSPIAAQVVLVDATGERMVGMYGRMARSG
ncbi:hypothetical protein [Actinomadura gamaensis]|uniref:Uncharacterized protein n=1 Tax=Actinomadura gamaensis TaxID=1763541 RepID=A0ABV9U4V9_9ACTN